MNHELECAAVTCVHNKRNKGKYGECDCPQIVVFKFRAAIDMAKEGTVVFMECLNLEIPQG